MRTRLWLWELVEEGVRKCAIDVGAQQDPVQIEDCKPNRQPLAALAEAPRLAQDNVQPCYNRIQEMDRNPCAVAELNDAHV